MHVLDEQLAGMNIIHLIVPEGVIVSALKLLLNLECLLYLRNRMVKVHLGTDRF